MKKYLFLGALAAALTGCGDKVNTVTVFDAECEQVATGAQDNFVVQCPITEKLTEVQGRVADSMFINGFDYYKLDEYAADVEHVYVEINPNASNGNQPIYRVMVKNPVFDDKTMYSVMAFEE